MRIIRIVGHRARSEAKCDRGEAGPILLDDEDVTVGDHVLVQPAPLFR
jgi:hypothetical protein